MWTIRDYFRCSSKFKTCEKNWCPSGTWGVQRTHQLLGRKEESAGVAAFPWRKDPTRAGNWWGRRHESTDWNATWRHPSSFQIIHPDNNNDLQNSPQCQHDDDNYSRGHCISRHHHGNGVSAELPQLEKGTLVRTGLCRGVIIDFGVGFFPVRCANRRVGAAGRESSIWKIFNERFLYKVEGGHIKWGTRY